VKLKHRPSRPEQDTLSGDQEWSPHRKNARPHRLGSQHSSASTTPRPGLNQSATPMDQRRSNRRPHNSGDFAKVPATALNQVDPSQTPSPGTESGQPHRKDAQPNRLESQHSSARTPCSLHHRWINVGQTGDQTPMETSQRCLQPRSTKPTRARYPLRGPRAVNHTERMPSPIDSEVSTALHTPRDSINWTSRQIATSQSTPVISHSTASTMTAGSNHFWEPGQP
jgi:hypothetical protein